MCACYESGLFDKNVLHETLQIRPTPFCKRKSGFFLTWIFRRQASVLIAYDLYFHNYSYRLPMHSGPTLKRGIAGFMPTQASRLTERQPANGRPQQCLCLCPKPPWQTQTPCMDTGGSFTELAWYGWRVVTSRILIVNTPTETDNANLPVVLYLFS